MTIQPPSKTTDATPAMAAAGGSPRGRAVVSTALAPPVVYLLADHLDSVLAHGEDLLACGWRPERTARCPATIATHQDMQRDTIRMIRTLELSLVSRALKARERARELAGKDGRFAPLAKVFAAATAALEDAAREAGDMTEEHFESGPGLLAYMRGRGMIAPDAADLDDCGSIAVTPKFMVARRIELEVVLDLTAAFLDAIEIHFDIYPDALPDAGTPPEVSTAEACGADCATADETAATVDAASPSV